MNVSLNSFVIDRHMNRNVIEFYQVSKFSMVAKTFGSLPPVRVKLNEESWGSAFR